MPETDETSEPRGAKRGLAFVAALGVGLPVLYLLSVGPVAAIMEKTNGFGGMIPRGFMIIFYWPIIWLYENTFMRHPIEVYLGLWGVK